MRRVDMPRRSSSAVPASCQNSIRARRAMASVPAVLWGEAKRLRRQHGTGFVQAGLLHRHELEQHNDETVGGLEDERRHDRRGDWEQQPQRQIDLDHAERVKGQLGGDQRGRRIGTSRGEGVDVVLQPADLVEALVQARPRQQPRAERDRPADQCGTPEQRPGRGGVQSPAPARCRARRRARNSRSSPPRSSRAMIPAAIIAATESV